MVSFIGLKTGLDGKVSARMDLDVVEVSIPMDLLADLQQAILDAQRAWSNKGGD